MRKSIKKSESPPTIDITMTNYAIDKNLFTDGSDH